jgi:hypothetical protein
VVLVILIFSDVCIALFVFELFHYAESCQWIGFHPSVLSDVHLKQILPEITRLFVLFLGTTLLKI